MSVRRIALAATLVASCYAIEPRSRSIAPMNVCAEFPCERYERGRTRADCEEGRCTAGSPTFAYSLLVHVPLTSRIGAGTTFIANEQDLRPREVDGEITLGCDPPDCLLVTTGEVLGRYLVAKAISDAVGYGKIDTRVSLPVQAVIEPIGRVDALEPSPPLPVDDLVAASVRPSPDPVSIVFSRAVAQGRYRRWMYPQPPFDEFFPPAEAEITVRERLQDEFELTTSNLDNPSFRMAKILRTQGLDGFRLWLANHTTKRRISVVRTLSGTSVQIPLFTTGQNDPDGTDAIEPDTDLVLEPPSGAIAVPRLENELIGGLGLELTYPPLPRPVEVSGFVASATQTPFPAMVTLSSTRIRTLDANGSSPILFYTTSVQTNEEGRFTTVLPPGTYDVRVEGLPTTGYGRKRTSIDVPEAGIAPFLISDVPLKTKARGRAVLSDGRPLAGAEVIAIPDTSTFGPDAPRPAQTVTDEAGAYTLDLDEGPYVVSVVPQEGSGFPRVVTRHVIPATDTELPEVRVPPPTVLSFTVRQREGERIPAPTTGAIVRVFRVPPGATVPVEIGRGMTDATGKVEILLADEPP